MAESDVHACGHELRQARHGAVVVQDFAENTGGLQTGEAREIDRGFGVTRAAEDTTFLRAQRKDVTRLDEIFGR